MAHSWQFACCWGTFQHFHGASAGKPVGVACKPFLVCFASMFGLAQRK
jgi:hypothetical protein